MNAEFQVASPPPLISDMVHLKLLLETLLPQ